MKIAVTGVAGRVGRYVARELISGEHEVVGLDLGVEPDLGLSDFVSGAVTDDEAVTRAFTGCDAIVHLAGLTLPTVASDSDVFNANVLGTFVALETAVSCGAQRFVFASSEATLGFNAGKADMHPEYLPIDEDHPTRPLDVYSLSKLVGEEMCRSYARRGAISTIALRSCYVWSLEWRANALDAITNADRARCSLWAYIDARDAAVAYRRACELSDVQHETVFIVAPDSGSQQPTAELLREFHPEIPTRRPIGVFGGLISGERARGVLGFEPRYTWRDQVTPADLAVD